MKSFGISINDEMDQLPVQEWTYKHLQTWITEFNRHQFFKEEEYKHILEWLEKEKIKGTDIKTPSSDRKRRWPPQFGNFDRKKLNCAFDILRTEKRVRTRNWGLTFSKTLRFQTRSQSGDPVPNNVEEDDTIAQAFEFAEVLENKRKFHEKYFSFFPKFFKYVNLLKKPHKERGQNYDEKVKELRDEVNKRYKQWTDKNFIRDDTDLKKMYEEHGIDEEKGLKKFAFKIVIIEMMPENQQKRRRELFSPILSILPTKKHQSMKYGLFHLAYIIGPWYLEWTTDGIVIPKKAFGSSQALISADIEHHYRPTEKDVFVVSKRLCKVLHLWNTTYTYARTRGKNCGNCQDFYEDICKELEVDEKSVRTSFLAPIIRKLKKKGKFKFNYKPCPIVREKCKLPKKITFTKHEDLDKLVLDIMEKVEEFDDKHDDYKLLKSFDRAFWLQYLKSFLIPCGSKEKNLVVEKSKPLELEDEMEEEDFEDRDALNEALTTPQTSDCPFSDPRETSSYLTDTRMYI